MTTEIEPVRSNSPELAAMTLPKLKTVELERAAGEKFQMIPLGVSRTGVSVVTA